MIQTRFFDGPAYVCVDRNQGIATVIVDKRQQGAAQAQKEVWPTDPACLAFDLSQVEIAVALAQQINAVANGQPVFIS